MEDSERLRELQARLADLKSRMPAHSVRPAMLMEIEDLEEEISQLKADLKKKGVGDA